MYMKNDQTTPPPPPPPPPKKKDGEGGKGNENRRCPNANYT